MLCIGCSDMKIMHIFKKKKREKELTHLFVETFHTKLFCKKSLIVCFWVS